jgi:predicted XRE-type DNA-binding protein
MQMDEELEVVRGSGNIFADVGLPNAEERHMKSRLAVIVLKRQEELKLTVRAAAKLAKCDAADIQRIRNADLKKFTIDRLIRYAINMGCKVELKVTQPKKAA